MHMIVKTSSCKNGTKAQCILITFCRVTFVVTTLNKFEMQSSYNQADVNRMETRIVKHI